MQHSVFHLQQRGKELASLLKEEQDEKRIEQLRASLREIKKAIDDSNTFISNYKGEEHE
jgi:C4-dicarboxylate-specific signal transduction histidine kinase